MPASESLIVARARPTTSSESAIIMIDSIKLHRTRTDQEPMNLASSNGLIFRVQCYSLFRGFTTN